MNGWKPLLAFLRRSDDLRAYTLSPVWCRTCITQTSVHSIAQEHRHSTIESVAKAQRDLWLIDNISLRTPTSVGSCCPVADD